MKAVKNRLRLALSVSLMAGLAGCSQKMQDVQDTMSLAIFGHESVHLSSDEIDKLPFASVYAKVEDSGQAFLVLGYAEKTYSNAPLEKEKYQLKWLSANNEMLVTEEGRLVKTVNILQGNLTASYSDKADPLALGLLKKTTPMHWKRSIDWQPGYYVGYTLESRFALQGKKTMIINEKKTHTLHYLEYVSAPELNVHFENQFWLDPLSGNVLASIQTLAPGLPAIEIHLLKSFSEKGQS